MNKKFLLIFLCIFVTITSVSCVSVPQGSSVSMATKRDYSSYWEMKSIAEERMEADVLPDSLGKIEDAKYIVCGYLMDNAQTHDTSANGYHLLATVSTLKITSVYKGEIKAEDSVPLVETYYISNDGGTETLYSWDGYYPSEPGKEYLFFLNGDPDNTYDPSTPGNAGLFYSQFGVNGRYPLISTLERGAVKVEEITNQELGLSADCGRFLYDPNYTEVIAKYMS